ncbi:hypothetical protein Q8W71_27170 [Methylobacterium sp. NEAU 140]|uniref:DUF6894 family protein n=1 Tax=Methylobacterium sp. NEAU 140 TaxID=3064945 RepID=UPI002732BB9D|nr:hypothetical protein [Methylobacterium sp. NEAU 140]MDP4026309.1 hypothetical protein [Methylobacterium sp. NEAU 140]
MPRFFFNVFDGRSLLDTDGVELPDDTLAREEALRIAGGAIAREAARIAANLVWNMEALDETGRCVYRINLSITTG